MSSQTSSKSSMWEKTKANSHKWFQKIGEPINKASNKLGAEAFWPTSLDKEADKAAKILRSFCIDGFVQKDHKKDDKHSKEKDIIPHEAIRGCKGLAIFTVMRTGLHWSGAGGSGIIVSKLPNGEWSPPAGILIHTLGWGFIAGADIYDCVCVINNEEGMQGFQKLRCTLGGEVSAAVGPLGGGREVESEIAKRQAPVWVYTKGRGLYVGVQIDGTIISQRPTENERFYGRDGVKISEILAGQVQAPSGAMVSLWETLQAAEGNKYDQSKLPPPGDVPGDHELEHPQQNSQKEYDDLATVGPDERMDRKS